jgi:ribosome maturation factor RimP
MTEKIKEFIEPIVVREGAELVDMVFRKESGRQVLRLLVDKIGGIKLSECVMLNESLSLALEESDLIPESYIVEVDSPGIDRWFTAKRDYERAKGRLVRVTLNEVVLDKKEYIGRLEDVTDNLIKVNVDKKGIIDIPFSKITRARQEADL